MTSLSPRYQRVYSCVDNVPRTATEIYRRWAELPEWKSLTRRHRNERKWLAGVLENLAAERKIARGKLTDNTTRNEFVAFWRGVPSLQRGVPESEDLDTTDAAGDPTVSAGGLPDDRRRVSGDVGQ